MMLPDPEVPQGLVDALAELGETEADVVAKLRAEQVTGIRANGMCCPVANWLKRHGIDGLVVARHEIWRDNGAEPDVMLIKTPSPIGDFIDAFDNEHSYSDLDEKPTARWDA